MCEPCCEVDKVKKIEGYDKWDIESAAESLTRAKEIVADTKLHSLAIAHIANKIEQEQKVLQGENVEDKVRKKMKSTFNQKG